MEKVKLPLLKSFILAIVYTEEANIFAGFHASTDLAKDHIATKYKEDAKGYSLQEVYLDSALVNQNQLFDL